MKGRKINTDQYGTSLKPNVLIAPLDWGLGHTTRCIPLIKGLLTVGCRVFLAGDKSTKAILLAEFPGLDFLELRGYQVRYTKRKWSLAFALITQLPRILKIIDYEHHWLEEAIDKFELDIVISDNRYGLYSNRISSIILTHQLEIRVPFQKIFGKWFRKKHYSFLNKFDECWIPDYEGQSNLSGALAHPDELPDVPVRYLGPLTRFSSTDKAEEKHLLILLSGPEPQRTIFENVLLKELHDYKEPVILVRGLPNEKEALLTSSNVTVYNHLSSTGLSQLIAEARLIVCRSGYSTVMDLTAFRNKVVFIPTPAQTEQEYLAQHLFTTNFAPYLHQHEFTLKKAMALSETFNYQFPIPAQVDHDQLIKNWIDHLPKQTINT